MLYILLLLMWIILVLWELSTLCFDHIHPFPQLLRDTPTLLHLPTQHYLFFPLPPSPSSSSFITHQVQFMLSTCAWACGLFTCFIFLNASDSVQVTISEDVILLSTKSDGLSCSPGTHTVDLCSLPLDFYMWTVTWTCIYLCTYMHK